jgi:hypothetical protein
LKSVHTISFALSNQWLILSAIAQSEAPPV